jgi:O-antigen ligase
MINLFLAFFCLLPWGNFFFKNIDCWHATGQFVQVGILILFSYSFFNKPKYIKSINKPLGSFIAWSGLITAYGWITVFSKTQHYPVKIFMPFFNLLCIILLYKLIIEYLDSISIEKILKWLRFSVIILLFYCVLQYLKLDEFFSGINNTDDQLVGTIGNSMHLAGLLAILQPLFFKKNIENILSLVLLWLLILFTGSATGLVAGIAVILFWLWFKNRKLAIIVSLISFGSLVSLYSIKSSFFFNNSRFNIWIETLYIIKKHFITGFGLGTFGVQNIKRGAITWQHLHNDYYQVVFELGLIGLILVIWCIWDYFKKFISLKNDLTIKLASIFFGFCLLCGVTFFSHLWQTAVIGMFSYASIYCLTNEELGKVE